MKSVEGSSRVIGHRRVITVFLAVMCFLSPLLFYPRALRESGAVWVHQQSFEGRGSIEQLLVVQGQGGVIYYLLTASGGVYRALDTGDSWVPANGPAGRGGLPRGGWGEIQVRDIAVSPSDPLVLFAAVQRVQRGRPTLYWTTDGGDTWWARGEMRDRVIQALAVAPANDQVVYAATEGALFRSADGGETWINVWGMSYTAIADREKWSHIEARYYDRVEQGDLWLVIGDRVWRSMDGGETWQEVTDGSYRDVGATGDWKVVEGEEYRSVDDADGWLALAGKLYRTTDEGRSWTRIGSDPGWGEVCTMRVSAIDPGVLYVGTTSRGLFIMRNGGATWQIRLPSTEIVAIVQGRQHPGLLYVATSQGLYRSMDHGDTWEVVNQDWAGRRVTAVALDSYDDRVVYASVEDVGIYRSSDGGMRWSPLRRGMGNEEVCTLATDPTCLGVVYAGTRSGLWRYSTREVVCK